MDHQARTLQWSPREAAPPSLVARCWVKHLMQPKKPFHAHNTGTCTSIFQIGKLRFGYLPKVTWLASGHELRQNLSISNPPNIHYLTIHRAASQARKKGQSQGPRCVGVSQKGLLSCTKPRAPIVHQVVKITVSQPGQVAKGVGPLLGEKGLPL